MLFRMAKCLTELQELKSQAQQKGGEQSPDSRTGGFHKTAPNGQNDPKFFMQGALMGLVETLEFQNTQRSEDSFSFPAQLMAPSCPRIWTLLPPFLKFGH